MAALRKIGYTVKDEKYITRQQGDLQVDKSRVDLLVMNGNHWVLAELKHSNDVQKDHAQLKRYMNHKVLKKKVEHGVLIGFPKKRTDTALIICHHGFRPQSHMPGHGKDIIVLPGLKPRKAVRERYL